MNITSPPKMMPRKKLPEDAIIGKRRFVCNLGRNERPNTTVYWKVRFLERIAARNTFELLNAWNDERMPYNVGTAAARLGVAPTCVIEHLKYILERRQLPNGVLEFMGGGIENNAIILATLQEMMLQSYEGIIRLFPNWDKTHFASFHNWRAYGAFLLSASINNGVIDAKIQSEKGKTLIIEKLEEGYSLFYEDKCISLNEQFKHMETKPGDIFTIKKSNN